MSYILQLCQEPQITTEEYRSAILIYSFTRSPPALHNNTLLDIWLLHTFTAKPLVIHSLLSYISKSFKDIYVFVMKEPFYSLPN